ncbi:cargo-transport protein YPP1, partial [Tremellales sp. Uapishka_1]
MSPSTPKGAHYHASLTSALLRGAWAETAPGTTPNGNELSWGELVRKWGKHTGGSELRRRGTSEIDGSSRNGIDTALIHHLRDISLLYLSSSHPRTSISASRFISVGSPSQPTSPAAATVALDPASGSSNSSGDTSNSFIHIPHPHLHRKKPSDGNGLALAASASGVTVRQDAGRTSYLGAKSLDGDDGDNEEWRGIDVENVEEAREGIKDLERLIHEGKLSVGESKSAKLILGYFLHAIGEHAGAIKIYRDTEWNGQDGVVEGDAAIVARIRGRTLQGISYELSSPPRHDLALESYLAALPLLSSLSSFPICLPPFLSATTTSPKTPFEPYRELHRHLSTSLARAATLSASLPNALPQTVSILRTYHSLSSCWPSNFRSHQRNRMLVLYLRGLQASHPAANTTPSQPILLTSPNASTTLSARELWSKEAISTLRQGRQLLSTTTAFPRAGSINSSVNTLSELSVALYDASSALRSLGREVLSLLYWAQTLTFQSQSILRHLTRLHSEAAEYADSKRVFSLYVQLVLKARQTSQPDVSLQLKKRATDDTPIHTDSIKEGMKDRAGEIEEQENEGDSDNNFIRTLMVGARVLCKDLGEPEESWSYLVLAGEVLELKEGRQVDQLRGEVEECKGIVRMALAMQGADPINRPIYQSQSINHLVTAVRLNPTSSTAYYHLAYSQAESRSIDPATESIRSSLELDAKNIQGWHLLALLLTARGDWEGGMKACEAGVQVWEASEDDDLNEDEVSHDQEGVDIKDFAITPPTPALQQESEQTAPLLPLKPDSRSYARPTVSRAKKLKHVISLRMTLVIITEKMLGPEMAMLRQQELFAFFSARSGSGGAGRRSKSMLSVATISGNGNAANEGFVHVEESGPGPKGLGESMISGMFCCGTGFKRRRPELTGRRRSVHPPEDEVEVGVAVGGESRLSQGEVDEKANGKRKLIPRHLHVPSTGGKANSIRSLKLEDNTAPRSRVASSAAASIAPTANYSHYHSPSHSRALPLPPPAASAESNLTTSEARILSNLWLMSASTFRRWNKPQQSLVAIEEAEVLDPFNPDVWVQLGLYQSFLGERESALQAFTKSILLQPDYPVAVTCLAELYLQDGKVELAHGLLNQLTQDQGWDDSAAWYWLARTAKAQGRRERERECLGYALGLEETKGCRRWREVEGWL